MNKNLAVLLSILILLAVSAGVYKSYKEKSATQPTLSGATVSGSTQISPSSLPGANLPPLKLITGSAKFALLKDPDLTRLLEKHGIRLELIKSGAFEADKLRAGEIDAAWPPAQGPPPTGAAFYPAARISQSFLPRSRWPLGAPCCRYLKKAVWPK